MRHPPLGTVWPWGHIGQWKRDNHPARERPVNCVRAAGRKSPLTVSQGCAQAGVREGRVGVPMVRGGWVAGDHPHPPGGNLAPTCFDVPSQIFASLWKMPSGEVKGNPLTPVEARG